MFVFGTLLVCLAVAVPAGAADKGWHLRVFAAGFDPSLDEIVPAVNPEEVRITGESDLGFGASLEYQFSSLLGLEVGAFRASPKVVISADIPGYGHLALTDSMATTVITLDLDFHLTPGSQYFDFFLGAGLANLCYGDPHYVDPDGDPLDVAVSNDLTYSAKAGLDIALGKNSNWAAFGGLRYIWSDLEVQNVDEISDNTATLDFNTFSFTVGVAVRF
jgi:outer membrane protein W